MCLLNRLGSQNNPLVTLFQRISIIIELGTLSLSFIANDDTAD